MEGMKRSYTVAAYMLVLVFASRQCASSVVQEPTARLNSVRLRLSHTLSHQQTLTTLKRPEASPLKTANATDAPLRASSHSVPYYPLTPLGRSIKRVIVSAMLPGVCQGSDWRGEIGRWLARFLPQVPVVIWEARRWRFGSDSDAGESIRCRRCRNPEAAVRRSKEYECSSLQRIGKGDLVVVVGTGNVGCVYKPSLRDLPQCDMGRLEKRALPSIEALDRVWDTNRTVKVHFPVRALQALTREANVFGFDTIIEDDSFFKPMGGRGEASDTIKNCYRNAKKSDLLYVARYKEYKGQLKFLSQADPALLTGYTIHFYGGGANEDAVGERYFRAISRTARAKDIRIVMHKHVEKENLLKRICTASGQILWPMEDSNPRAAYEGLYAGLPLFISTTAGVPEPLLDQAFVEPVPFDSEPEDFNTHLESFMKSVAEHQASVDMRRKIIKYTQTALDPRNVYWELCERMGICAAMSQPGADVNHTS